MMERVSFMLLHAFSIFIERSVRVERLFAEKIFYLRSNDEGGGLLFW